MRIVSLMENTDGGNGCFFEHGFSFYIETKKHKLLVDTGASPAFLENAKKLSVDPAVVDAVILSHGHYDHGGGILAFAEQNPDAAIYIRENAFGHFTHGEGERERNIGLDAGIAALSQVIRVKGNLRIDEELSLFTNVTGRELWPEGNKELMREENGQKLPDDFSHEQYLVIFCEGKRILVSGCAHNGVLNILKTFEVLFTGEPDVVISGFHMMKKHGYTQKDREIVEMTAKRLKATKTVFFTCHCTGGEPYGWMKEIMGEQISYIRSGQEIRLDGIV